MRSADSGQGGGDGGSGWDCHVHVFDANRPGRAGHYRPVTHPLVRIEALAAAHGVQHLVLVQPSVYGSDNSLMLQALAVTPGRHRGVAVLADEVSDTELDALHAAGVRGARLNLVSPVGEDRPITQRFDRLAPRLKARGWHLQWYVSAERLPEVAALHAGSGVVGVLDHLAGMGPDTSAHRAAWRALTALAAAGAWVKLSGWYRLQASTPYAALLPHIRRVAERFEDRLVWGSDWPHTAFPADALPAYDSLWQPVVDALGPDAAAALRERAPAIYS